MIARTLAFDGARLDSEERRSRTRRSMTLSFAFHAAILLAILLRPPVERSEWALTELTLLDPSEEAAAPAGAPAAAQAGEPVIGLARASEQDVHFRRERRDADFSPDPQLATIAADRMSERLAALRERTTDPSAIGASIGAPKALTNVPAGVAGGTPGGSGPAISLDRGAGLGGPPLALGRGAAASGGMAVAAAGTAPSATMDAPSGASATERAQRRAAGAMLAGPIADRPILSYVTPRYPDWAKKDGIEGTVTLYFIVRPDGSVRENVLVQKTAGFGEFDDNARDALRAWRFQPLRGGEVGDQWGTITFHFRLRGA